MSVGNTKDVTLGNTKYQIKLLPAIKGLQVMEELDKSRGVPSPELLRALVLESVTVNNIQPTGDWFDKHFARNYKELYNLFNEIVDFNFGDEFGGEEGGKEQGPNPDTQEG